MIIHLNMRSYGGRSQHRNRAYARVFDTFRAGTADRFGIAGFTEIRSAGRWAMRNLPRLARRVQPGLRRTLFIEVGSTAFGSREYVAIAWDPRLTTVEYHGHVLYDNLVQHWTPFHYPYVDNRAQPTQVVGFPNGRPFLNQDARGPAFIAGRFRNRYAIFVFLHNMHNHGNRFGLVDSLGAIVQAIRVQLGGNYQDAEVVIGGDFNVRPRDPRRNARGGVRLFARVARDGQGRIINTTARNPYDYWIVSRADVTDAAAAVSDATRRPGASDHAVTYLSYN